MKKGKTVKTADLAKVKSITFTSDFKGTIKGLEYFTGLETFDDSAITAGEIKNESLDFAANTSLTEIKVTKAAGLKEITLPEADADEVYHLDSLTLTNTKLNALDLTKQEALTTLEVTNADFASLDLATQKELETLTLTNTNLTALDLSAQKELAVTVTGNKNLKDIVLNNGKKGKPVTLTSLDLQNNALETVNLDHIAVTGTLNLNGNHIGALDLSTTKVATGNLTLDTQKFYVSENAANVMLTEAFSDLEVWNVKPQGTAKFDKKTGVLTLSGDKTTYKYNVAFDNNGTKAEKDMTVELEAANPMNRLYNPNSGEHFYTADIKEKEALVKLGWNDEGYGWVAPKMTEGDKVVYRLYNPNAGDHHYTVSAAEKKTLVSYGWKYEGEGWKSAEKDGNTPVYRQYNPYANGAGSHNYTTDKAENDYLVSLGWTPEGTAWYAHR